MVQTISSTWRSSRMIAADTKIMSMILNTRQSMLLLSPGMIAR